MAFISTEVVSFILPQSGNYNMFKRLYASKLNIENRRV